MTKNGKPYKNKRCKLSGFWGLPHPRPDSSSQVGSMFLLDIKGQTHYTFPDEKRNKRTTRQIKRSDWFLCLNE